MKKEDVKKALWEAKKLEKKSYLSKKQIQAVYDDGMKQAQKLRKLLKPTWFVQETRRQKKKSL